MVAVVLLSLSYYFFLAAVVVHHYLVVLVALAIVFAILADVQARAHAIVDVAANS